MRRIFITSSVKKLAEDYRDNLFVGRNKNFHKPLANLSSFENEIRTNNTKWSPRWNDYADYVKAIIDHFQEILTLKPSEFDGFQKKYFSMLSFDEIKSTGWKSSSNVAFYLKIVELMRYDEVRASELIPYIEKLGIRTCVYCNSQYTVTTHVNKNEVKGGYQLDHYYPKAKYPFLCISFFNLQPSCGCCNNWKEEKQIEFNLYTDITRVGVINPFSFRLDKASMVRYMLSQDCHTLEIVFDSNDKNLLHNHEMVFHTSKLYENFKDEAEELLWKKKISNSAYIEQLQIMFQKTFPNIRGSFNRYLYGIYDNEKDIHKRPLTKMKQDIARQLKLIK